MQFFEKSFSLQVNECILVTLRSEDAAIRESNRVFVTDYRSIRGSLDNFIRNIDNVLFTIKF